MAEKGCVAGLVGSEAASGMEISLPEPHYRGLATGWEERR